jgi:hypothetical protein
VGTVETQESDQRSNIVGEAMEDARSCRPGTSPEARQVKVDDGQVRGQFGR